MRSSYLVEERPSPTTDFFLSPFVASAMAPLPPGQSAPTRRCGFGEVPPLRALDSAEVIFVRYLPRAWVRTLSHPDLRLRRLALFIDDDLLDLRAWGGLPWRYRWKLFWLSGRHLGWLERRLQRGQAELWVGSVALQRKYARFRPRLILPRPIQLIQPAPISPGLGQTKAMRPAPSQSEPILRDPLVTYPLAAHLRQQAPQGFGAAAPPRRAPRAPVIQLFYHGSASHQREHVWVQQLMRGLLAADPRLGLEVIADQRIARGYLGLPRVQVIRPMDWLRYRAFIQLPGRHIGLAPLLPSAFNATRSYTKFFDIAAAGSVGLYTRGSVYEEIVEHEQDGLLLPLDPERWIAEILDLATDTARRERLVFNAMRKINAQRRTGGSDRHSRSVSDSMDSRHNAAPAPLSGN